MKFNFKLEEIIYVKILYKDNNGTACIIKAGIKRFDDREILACGKLSNKLNITIPQEVVLSVVCNDGLYRTKTTLKSIENEEPYIFFLLETPKGIEYEQNREYFRVPVEYDCTYRIYEGNETREYKAKTADISANGISIILPNHPVSNNNSDITITINEKTIRTKVRYIRSEKNDKGYRLSFAFTQVSENDRDFISQVCLQKQIEQRRKNFLR